jgi:hypothetical protein
MKPARRTLFSSARPIVDHKNALMTNHAPFNHSRAMMLLSTFVHLSPDGLSEGGQDVDFPLEPDRGALGRRSSVR